MQRGLAAVGRSRWWYWAVPVVAGAALLPLGGAPAMLGVSALAYTAWASGLVRRHGRRDASHAIETLPFPVTHRPSAGADPDGTPRPVVSVQIRLRDDAAAERTRLMAVEMLPDLLAVAEDDLVTLSCWRWGARDLAVLSHVLSTWGLAVHAATGIVDVAVDWEPQHGPVASL